MRFPQARQCEKRWKARLSNDGCKASFDPSEYEISLPNISMCFGAELDSWSRWVCSYYRGMPLFNRETPEQVEIYQDEAIEFFRSRYDCRNPKRSNCGIIVGNRPGVMK